MLAHDMARAQGGAFLLRIEDIDRGRSRPEWEDLICEDLHWLGLSWDEPAMRQCARLALYRDRLQALWSEGLVYACRCNRRDIIEAAGAPHEGTPVVGPDGVVYPGTCRGDGNRAGAGRETPPKGAALRLDMARALDRAGAPLLFTETGAGPGGETGRIAVTAEAALSGIGDVVLARRDMGTSYHLSVVVDDADQRISHVVRGQDLFEATAIHVLLQRLLGLPTPLYHHHRLIRDEAGKRLAKRDDARAIRTYRDEGATPAEIRRMVGL